MFDFEKIKDPAYFAENRVPAHSDHVAYASWDEQEAGVSSLRHSLNGHWKFMHARVPEQVPPRFMDADYDCRVWDDIVVPAHIQMEGYGVPQYCNIQYPWDGSEALEPGELPQRFNPVACYVKYFALPEAMRGKRVFISFQGAESCVAVWLNGKYIGFSSDSFTPSDFDLTDALMDGENKLACAVTRFSAGSWLEDQDFMRFSGLFRDVFLYAKPETHVDDIAVKTELSEQYTKGTLRCTLKLSGDMDSELRIALMDGEEIVSQTICAAKEAVSFDLPIDAPKLWSSECPNLYSIRIEVCKNKETIEVIEQKVGFRTVEIIDGILLVNGVRAVFKGVNRHDFCAETGRAVTEEKLRRDLITMKKNNINAVRTSHYPNHSALYRLCDELGLYVIDENNMETHGVWDVISRGKKDISFALPGDRQDWKDILFDRVNSVFQRDKNHPSVIMWSCGNESMGGTVILEMSRLFKQLDGTRPVHYEGVYWDPRYPETTDVYSQMYTPAAKVREFVQAHPDKPFILCEYTHSMGNSNGGMHHYTELAYEEPHYQGGFIWDFLDQSIQSKDRYGMPHLNYGGDNGERPHDGNFNGNGIVYGDGSWSPKLQEVKYNYQNLTAKVSEDAIEIENRSMFTPSSAYECVLTLLRDGVAVEKRVIITDIPAGGKAVIPQPFRMGKAAGEYAVTVAFLLKEDMEWAPRGHEVAFGQGVIGVVDRQPMNVVRPALRVVRGTNNLGIFGEDFSVMFDLMAGGLRSYRYGNAELLKGMPQPFFWRAPTDNDRGWGMPAKLSFWKVASMYLSAGGGLADSATSVEKDLPIEEHDDGSVSITFHWTLPGAKNPGCDMAYRVFPCGRVQVTLHWAGDDSLPMLPAFGVMLKMDADYDNISWYGLGPDENYVDRREGARLGTYKKKVGDNMARYLIPQECGNVTGVRFATVTDLKGRALRFEGDGLEFSALPWTPHEVENALHSYELPPVHYTVLRVNLLQMGVAGDNSWGAMPLPEYTFDAGEERTLVFSFRGVLG